jgi:hypothetical protein
MTSAINPNNIDGAYPVAGQDNNSQGFRDNFTNTKTNFEYAADEITDLQNKAVLKAALDGTVLNNNMQGAILSNAQLQDMSETALSLGTVSGSATLNYSLSSHQSLTTGGNVTLGFSNWPNTGAVGSLVLQVTVTAPLGGVPYTLTLTTPSPGTWVNAVGITGCAVSGTNAVITFASAGVYTFGITTGNGGSTLKINQGNSVLLPFNNSSEDLSNGSAANLAVTASYFSTVTTESATLAAGVNGQIKTFAMYADNGPMVIIVTNYGWNSGGSVGAITFNNIGDACTLQYINGRWFCIGNNGAVFS